MRFGHGVLALCVLLNGGCRRIFDELMGDGGSNQPQNPAPTPQVPTTPPPQQPQQQPQQNTGPFGLPIPSIPGLPIPGTNQGGGTSGPPPRVGDTTPLPQGSLDATGGFTMGFLQVEARWVLDTLVASLEPDHLNRVRGVPLQFHPNIAEVNAAAGCGRESRMAFMYITAGILQLSSSSAEAKAVDEFAGTQLLTAYQQQTVTRVEGDQPIMGLVPGSVPQQWAMNPQKLARQRFLFDSQIAFVLGHELAHHYRGHTGCNNTGSPNALQTDMENAHRTISNLGMIFNQPTELEADTWGIISVLDAGRRRTQGQWNEDGASLSMDFFARLERIERRNPAMLFVRSHPPAIVRRPIVQYWAQQWRSGNRPSSAPAGGQQGGQTGNTNNAPQLPIPLPFPFPGTR